jgi:hypothetical protein
MLILIEPVIWLAISLVFLARASVLILDHLVEYSSEYAEGLLRNSDHNETFSASKAERHKGAG